MNPEWYNCSSNFLLACRLSCLSQVRSWFWKSDFHLLFWRTSIFFLPSEVILVSPFFVQSFPLLHYSLLGNMKDCYIYSIFYISFQMGSNSTSTMKKHTCNLEISYSPYTIKTYIHLAFCFMLAFLSLNQQRAQHWKDACKAVVHLT